MGTRLARLRPQATDPREGHRLARRGAPKGRSEGATAAPGRSGPGFEPLDPQGVWPSRYLGQRLGGSPPDPGRPVPAGGGPGLVGLRFQLRRGPIAQAAAIRADPGGLEAEADRTADAAVTWSRFGSQPGAGAADTRSLWGYFNSRLGQDLSQVRIHAEGPTGRALDALGANAATQAEDIYFGTGRYRPVTPEGAHLLAHELTHVVQQRRGGAPGVQFDLRRTLPVAHGEFVIDMDTALGQYPGLEGTIRFVPDPQGPVSARIGLIQAARVIDQAGRTANRGQPMDPTQLPRDPWPTEALELETTGAHGDQRGWSLDVGPAANPRGSATSPAYIEAFGSALAGTPQNRFGWHNSPTDWGEASLYDHPHGFFDSDFEFETAARAMDTGQAFGAIGWCFRLRHRVGCEAEWGAWTGEGLHPRPCLRVEGENAWRLAQESREFAESMELFRGYYVHEPLVVYFCSGESGLSGRERDRILEGGDYAHRYPDVTIAIQGYADRGEANAGILSQQRAEAAEFVLLHAGIGAERIRVLALGATSEFSVGASAGSGYANRRAVIRFERTAAVPVAPAELPEG